MSFFDAVLHLWSFSHSACDSALQTHHIELMNINLHKGPADFSIYGGSGAIVVGYAIITRNFIWAWRKRHSPKGMRYQSLIYISPVFAIVGLISIWLQGRAIVDYVSTCHSLLGIR